MLDKNELEDLLVKLRLGTITIESAVTEIEKNFYSVDDNENISIWQKLDCPFEELVECENLSAAQIENEVSKMIQNKIDFILTGVQEDIIPEISVKFNKCKVHYEAGIIQCITKSRERILDNNKKVLIVSSLKKEEKIVAQTEILLNLLGIPVDFYNVSQYKTVSMQVLKTYIHTSNVVVVIYDKDIRLPSIVSNISGKPVIVLSKKSQAEEYMLSNGALLAKPGSAVSVCMAALRYLK